MLYRLIDILQCPVDGGFPLSLDVIEEVATDQPFGQPERCQICCAHGGGLPAFEQCVECHQREIVTGELVCQTCGAKFEITDGIVILIDPGFLADENSQEIKDQRAEMKIRDMMAAQYDFIPPIRWMGRFEVRAAAGILDKAPCGSMIELGCGTGRATAVLAQRADFFLAVDFSLNSLKICREKLRQSPHVQFVQAEISDLPIRDGVFDTAFSLEVFEHLPSALTRDKAVREAARALAENGRFVISVYRESRSSRLFGSKEGYHNGGIYYVRFSPGELSEMLRPYFEIDVHYQRVNSHLQMAGGRKRCSAAITRN